MASLAESSIQTGDAIEQMRLMPAASVDCVVTDPPYGDTSLAWDVIVSGWDIEVLRLLKPTGSMWVFGSFRYLMRLIPEMREWSYAQDIVWEKHNGSCANPDRFRRVHELAVQFYPRNRKWCEIYKNPQTTADGKERVVRRSRGPDHHGQRGAGTFISAPGGRRLARSVIRVQSTHGRAIHPTQKPEGIVAPLVRYSCPPGGVVLDCFAGSGTTGVVCVQESRRFLGIEKDAVMANKARRRIADEVAKGRQQTIDGVA